MKNNLLLTLADENYIDQAKQLFSSVYWNAGWKGDYMLLAYNISERDLQWFKDKGILIKKCESILTASEAYIGHAPLTTLSKFYLFTPEFKKWKNIVFLDGDIIVRGSLDRFTAVKGFAAARILNVFRTSLKGQFHHQNRKNKHLFKELKRTCDVRRPAFNAGLMAFCTDLISEDDFQNLKNILLHFKDIIYIAEETVLNIYFYDKWQELSQVYNICPNYERFLAGGGPDDSKGIVLHTYSNYRGDKPWNPESPFYAEWKANLDKADRIDCANPQAPKKTLSTSEEVTFDFYLKNLKKRYFYKFYPNKIRFFYRLFRMMAPTFLKKNYPRVYTLQRRLKNKP